VAEQAGLKLLVESGRLPHRKVGSHRRIAFDDLISCSRRMPEQQASALERMADNARELGLKYWRRVMSDTRSRWMLGSCIS